MKQSNKGVEMKVITAKTQVILTNIKSIYLNPYHYTYVIQKEDNHIYLYDQMTMQIVGKSKVPFNENFRNFMFTDNFNVFWAYIEARNNPHIQNAQIIIFTLQPDGLITHSRQLLTRKSEKINLHLYNTDFYEVNQNEQYMVGVSSHKIHYINCKGQVVQEFDIEYNGKKLDLINAFMIKPKKWMLVEDCKLYFATIQDNYHIDDQIDVFWKIMSIFKGGVKNQFIAFITDIHSIVILSQKGQKWGIRQQLKIPNLNIKKLSFFSPGVNTSTTNRFKDRIYLLIYGEPSHFYNQNKQNLNLFAQQPENALRQIEKKDLCPIPNELLKEEYLYIHEYSIEDLTGAPSIQDYINQSKKVTKPMLKNTFCLKNVGVIKYTIWANEHCQNCIKIFNQSKCIVSINLIAVLQQTYAGKEWVCLGYRFQARSSNLLYEQTEDNFENQKKKVGRVEIGQLDDWSYSLFSKESVLKKTIKRLNCIQF